MEGPFVALPFKAATSGPHMSMARFASEYEYDMLCITHGHWAVPDEVVDEEVFNF